MVHLDRHLVDILPVAVAVGLLIDRVLIWCQDQVAQVEEVKVQDDLALLLADPE
jgi:hypothetical protein